MLSALFLAAAFSAQVRVDPLAQQVEQTRRQLAKGVLPSKSRAVLEKAASSQRPDLALAAIAKLEWAVQLKLYPKPKLLKTIERGAELAPYWWGVNFAAEYGRTLGLKLTGDRELDAAGLALIDRHESPRALSHEDRALVLRCLSANTVSGRLDALYAILPKKHLPKPDAAWIRSQLVRESAKRTGDEREFWRFAERSAKYRGAG